MNKHKQRLQVLRKAMAARGIDAFIVPITDPHLGEYMPPHWRIIEWLTGFTGSAGNVVVTDTFAGLWTDSRYFIQAEKELDGSGFDLVKLKIPHTPEYIEWLADNMPERSVVACDGAVMPAGTAKLIENAFRLKKISFDPTHDLVSGIWTDRPAMPGDSVFEHEIKYAGESREQKIARVRRRMQEMGTDYHLLTSLDDMGWLLNLRGNDVKFSPLFTAFSIISQDSLTLFMDVAKTPDDIISMLNSAGVEIKPYNDIEIGLSEIPADSTLLLTPATTSVRLIKSVPGKVSILEDVSIPTRLKAIKNSVEQDHIRRVMEKDGVALTKFFFWLENSLGRERITEISASEKLVELRMEQEGCQGPSFATISGYNEHGASPHYCSTPESDVELKRDGIFLLDSGGQYLDGTTDVTRTIALGTPTDRQKSDFTLALKGTIGLASVKFPKGTRGYQLEVLARKALWDHGLNYGHGTGHGVGFFLNVHEGPQTIGTGASGDMKTTLEPGMLTADEPAIYREGEYGFRTENLLLCREDSVTPFGEFYSFETVTLCHIDSTLLEVNLLTNSEIEWLNDYHTRVFDSLSPMLDSDVRIWLAGKTKKIVR